MIIIFLFVSSYVVQLKIRAQNDSVYCSSEFLHVGDDKVDEDLILGFDAEHDADSYPPCNFIRRPKTLRGVK
jgi:hypothetical protein